MKVRKPKRNYIFFFQGENVFTVDHTTDLEFRIGHNKSKDGDYLFTNPIPPHEGETVLYRRNSGWERVPLFAMPKVFKAYLLATGEDIS